MVEPTFDQVQSQIQLHYGGGEYAEALKLATRMAPLFPEQAPLFYYWRICMTARLNQSDQSLQLLDEVLDAGIWYGEPLLRRSPSLKPLQGLPTFERIVERNREIQAQDESQVYPVITLRSEGECEKGSLPCPCLVALHGNASTALASVDFWRPAASAGWLVAVPQSSQAVWKNAYVWDDLEVTEQQIQRHIELIYRQYSVDPLRTVLAGHSMGGEVAIWLALTGSVETNGFIAVGPGGPMMDDLDRWTPLIAGGELRGLRGYFITGEQDDSILLENIQALIERLNTNGIPSELEIIPQAGHGFIPEYEEALLRGLDFVIEE
jgi:pimeloyl-ACP methyl ester carboxylesterase